MNQEQKLRRERLLQTMKENRTFLKSWIEESKKEHARAMKVKHEREKMDLRFELTMKEKKDRNTLIAGKRAREDMLGGIDSFEKTLQAIGKDPKTIGAETREVGPSTSHSHHPSMSMATPLSHSKIVNNIKPIPVLKPEQEVHEFMKRVKRKKEDEVVARKDREQRRRKILIEQQRVFHFIEEKRRKEIILEKLLKKSEEEKKLGDQIQETRKWKDVMKENRLLRERQIEERRVKDKLEEEEKKRQIVEQEYKERKERAAILQQSIEEKEKQRALQKKNKYFEICSAITNDLISLACKEIQMKEMLEGAPISDKTRAELHLKVIKGESIDDPVEIVEEVTVSDEISQIEFVDYVRYQSVWEKYAKLESHVNPFIQQILKSITMILQPPPPVRETPAFQSTKRVNAVVLGKPLCGKSAVCQSIATEFGLLVIDPEAILKNATSALNQGISPDNVQNEYDRQNLSLVQELLPILLKGQEIPIPAILSLIMTEIKRAESDENCSGWIIDGYPNTIESAMMIEKEISGYDPEDKYRPKSSILAPIEEMFQSQNYPFIAFTSVIMIDVDNDTIFERSAAQKVDVQTGDVYHMIYNPPISEDVELIDRLIPIEFVQYDKGLLTSKLVNFNKSRKSLINWFSQFQNLCILEGGENIEDLITEVRTIISGNVKEEYEVKTKDSQKQQEDEITETEVDNILRVEVDVAQMFESEWYQMEEIYRESILTVFKHLKEEKAVFLNNMFECKQQFIKYLKQPDERQDIVNQFIVLFNQLPLDLRSSLAVKQELQSQAEELKEDLWSLSDKKIEEAEKELEEISKQPWIEEHEKVVLRNFLQLLDVEVRRYAEQCKFALEYYYETNHREQIDISVEELIVDVIHLAQDSKKKRPASNQKNRKPAKSGRSSPTQDPVDLNMDLCIEKARGVVKRVRDVLQEKDKKVLKKTASRKQVTIEEPLPSEIENCLETEERLFFERIECIYDSYQDTLNVETKQKIQQLVEVMNTWIDQRYQAEVSSIGKLIDLVCDTIETERRLENYLHLSDRFMEDQSLKFLEPEELENDEEVTDVVEPESETNPDL